MDEETERSEDAVVPVQAALSSNFHRCVIKLKSKILFIFEVLRHFKWYFLRPLIGPQSQLDPGSRALRHLLFKRHFKTKNDGCFRGNDGH